MGHSDVINEIELYRVTHTKLLRFSYMEKIRLNY